MKKKFTKILGVGLTLALLTSLLLTAAPVAALSSATVTIPATDDEISFDDAEYSIFFTVHEELAGLDGGTFSLPDTGDQIIISDSAAVAEQATLTTTSGAFTVTMSGGGNYTAGVITFDGTGTETATVEATVDNTAGTWARTFGTPTAAAGTDVTQPPTVAAAGGAFSLPDATPAPGDDFVITAVAITDVATLTVTTGSVGVVMSGAGTWTPATGVIAFAAIAETATVSATADGTAGTWIQTTGAPTAAIGTDVNQTVVVGGLTASGDTITITFPEDTVLSVALPTAIIAASDGWVGTSYVNAILNSTAWSHVAADRTLTYTMAAGDRIGASAQVMINVTVGITNPTTPADDYTLTVETSQEDAVESAAYTISPPDIAVPAGVVRVFNPSNIEFQPQTGNNAISAAIGIAGDDWLIVIGEGTYTGAIATTGGVDGEGLTIQGAAGADVIIEANMTIDSGVSATTEATFTLENVTIDGTLTLADGADSAVIDNCTFEGAGAIIIQTGCDTPDITDCSFDVAALATGITCQGDGEADITGSSFTLADTAIAINVAAVADGGTVDDCTFTGGSGDGIILAGDTTVSDCTFDGLDWALQIVGGTQVISGNTIQACDEIAIDINGAVDVTITGNTITGNNEAVLLDVAVAVDAALVQVMFNDILDNAGDADGLLINNNDTTADLNCANNWWGDPEGPGAAAFSDDVLFTPFLTASVGDTGVIGTNVAAGTLWDERTTAGVTLRAVGGAMEIVGAAQYASNPGAAVDGTALAFRDVCVIDTDNDVTSVTIRLYLPGITADTEAYVWAAARGEWLECSNYAPNLFGGFVVITVTDATSPTIEDLEELPFVLVAGEAAAIDAPDLTAPASGAEDVSLKPILTWGTVAGAIGYDFELADNSLFVAPMVKLTGDLARLIVPFYQQVTELDYSTYYYWRVKAVSATAESMWNAGVFSTVAEVIPEPEKWMCSEGLTFDSREALEAHLATAEAHQPVEPADIVVEPPDIIVPIPAETPITPAWIYVIIGVGAVLVIALIVLIVRTRRVA